MNIGQTINRSQAKFSFKATVPSNGSYSYTGAQLGPNAQLSVPELAIMLQKRHIELQQQQQMQAQQEERMPQGATRRLGAASSKLPNRDFSKPTVAAVEGKRHFPIKTVGTIAGLGAAAFIGAKVVPPMFDGPNDQSRIAEVPAAVQTEPSSVQIDPSSAFEQGYRMAHLAREESGNLWNLQRTPERIAQLSADGDNVIDHSREFVYPDESQPPIDYRDFDTPEERTTILNQMDTDMSNALGAGTYAYINRSIGQKPIVGADGQQTVGVRFALSPTKTVTAQDIAGYPGSFVPISSLQQAR